MNAESKPLRRVLVDGRFYLWDATATRDGYVARVRSADTQGQLLRIERIPLLAQDMRSLSPEGDIEDLIPEMIRAALRRNWRPETADLPDFVL